VAPVTWFRVPKLESRSRRVTIATPLRRSRLAVQGSRDSRVGVALQWRRVGVASP
jgi:hypothetical protein